MAAMTRSEFKSLLWEGLNTVFGLNYTKYQKEWPMLFETQRSTKAWEEDVLIYGFDQAPEKPEGEGIAYDQGGEAWTSRYVNKTYGLAFAITEEARDDNQYGDLGRKYSAALARSMYYTEEIVHADIFNNAFSTSYVGGDGKPLLSTTHPLARGGTFRNKLATPADLSETSLEAACIDIENFVDDAGIPVKVMVDCLAIPNELKFVAERILKSTLRPGTADNDVNALNSMGAVPKVVVSHYFTDTDAWFLKTDAMDGLKHMERKGLTRKLEGDFETGNLRYKVTRRFAAGWTDPRGLYGSEGAA